MFEVNVKIIADLKEFIMTVAGDRELLKHFCIGDKDFIRTRKLPFGKLVLLITKSQSFARKH